MRCVLEIPSSHGGYVHKDAISRMYSSGTHKARVRVSWLRSTTTQEPYGTHVQVELWTESGWKTLFDNTWASPDGGWPACLEDKSLRGHTSGLGAVVREVLEFVIQFCDG